MPVVSNTLPSEQSRAVLVERWEHVLVFVPPTADALRGVCQGSSCSLPPLPSLSSIHALSLLSITPDCIWQMPLLAPYHQVRWRQPKTILLPPYNTSVLHSAWLTHSLLCRSNGARALSVEQLHESQVPLAVKEVLMSALDMASSVDPAQEAQWFTMGGKSCSYKLQWQTPQQGLVKNWSELELVSGALHFSNLWRFSKTVF